MVRIDWSMGPEYPIGIQDSALGVVGNTLISAGGFSRNVKDILASCPDAFAGEPSGFTNLTFALDLGATDAGWQRIADVPANPPRQGGAAVVVDDELYVIGGFNYTPPNTYRDVFRLRWEGGDWSWEQLPCLTPWPVCETSAVCLGKRIYMVGGFDYFAAAGPKGDVFHAERGREDNAVGNALFVLDTERLEDGWQRCADLPGTSRGDVGAVPCSGRIWVIQGVFAPLLWPAKGSAFHNVVDSWVYDPASDAWSRIADAPDGSNRSAVAWRDRYVLLVGEYRYEKNLDPDGSTKTVYTDSEQDLDWKEFFRGAVIAYDTQSDTYRETDSLLERTSYPLVAIHGDTLFSLGGEGGRLWHPDTLQVGRVWLE